MVTVLHVVYIRLMRTALSLIEPIGIIPVTKQCSSLSVPKHLKMKLGDLVSVLPNSSQEYFDIVREDTAHDARLSTENLPAKCIGDNPGIIIHRSVAWRGWYYALFASNLVWVHENSLETKNESR